VLRARQRATRCTQRGLVRVAIRLVERHLAVAVLVRRTQESREEGVGEEASLELVRLLAVLGGRAGGEEHRALAGHALAEPDLERRDRSPALDPGQRAGATGIEDQQPETGRRAADQLLQLAEIEP